jgi:hypothetical protein
MSFQLLMSSLISLVIYNFHYVDLSPPSLILFLGILIFEATVSVLFS